MDAPEEYTQKKVRHVFPANASTRDVDIMPRSMMSQLTQLAGCFFMDKTASVIVKGPKSSGKTYLIEYFALLVGEFAKRAKRDPVHLIHLSGADLAEIGGGPHMVPQYVDGLCASLSMEPHNICFVIRDADLAMQVRNYVPDCHIILEANHSYIDKTPLPIWSDWMHFEILQGDTPTFQELVKVVELSPELEAMVTRMSGWLNMSSKEAAIFILDMMNNELGNMSDGRVGIMNDGNTMALTTGQVVSTLKIFWTMLSNMFSSKYNSPVIAEYNKVMSRACIMYRDNTIGPEGNAPSQRIVGASDEWESRNPNHPLWRPTPALSDFSTLEKRLKDGLYGQDEAIEKVSDALIAAGAGFKKPEKPLRSFLFLGPSGVGKTQLAKNIAERFFASKSPMLRLDMSEFADRYSVSRLTGATSGYIGYEEGGQLTNFVTNNPYGVIVLDEVEKAHPRAWDIFLQVLDAGRLTDGQGNEVDFSHFIVVMTSNIGAKNVVDDPIGFARDDANAFAQRQALNKKAAMTEMRKIFRDEFINRIDEIVVFSELSDDIFDAIVSHEIKEVKELLSTRYDKIRMYSTKDVNKKILEGADIRKFGAREIQRVVQQKLVTPISKIVTTTKPEDLKNGYISCSVPKSSGQLEVIFKQREKSNGDKNG